MQKLTRTIFLSLALLISGTGSSWGADYNKGVDAYTSGDYGTAFREWEPLAEQGNAFAQYGLGYLYEQGLGVPEDDETAVKWYTLAAEQGVAGAQFNLGLMYAYGEGVPRDYKTALKWNTLAEKQGYADAQKWQSTLKTMLAQEEKKTKQSDSSSTGTTVSSENPGERLLETKECVKCDLSGADLSGAKLSGANLVDARLFKANLTNAKLSGADLSGANLTNAKLSGANLVDASLFKAKLTNADLSGADLSRANLSGADLSGANLTNAKLSGADLSRANLSGADLSRANLTNAKLSGANLVDASLFKANLTNADLSGADLSGAKLSGANLVDIAIDDSAIATNETLQEREKEQQRLAEEKEEREKEQQRLAEEKERLAKEKRQLELEKIALNPGFRDLKPGLTREEIRLVCPDLPDRPPLFPFANCYGIENMKFAGEFNEAGVLLVLKIDLGPYAGGGFVQSIAELMEDDPLLNMRATLGKKYKMDYDYNEKDRQMFNEFEKGKLYTVFANGQVALLVARFSGEIRSRIEYRHPSIAESFLESNRPKRATSSDF